MTTFEQEYAPSEGGSATGQFAEMALLVGVGAVWAVLASISFFLPEDTGSATIMQGLGLVAALLGVFIASPRFLGDGLRTFPGGMTALYASFATLSGILNDAHLAAMLRDALVFPTVLIFAGIAARGGRSVAAMRAGLTFGGLVLVLPMLGVVNFSNLLNPHYRFTFGVLNPNALGFVSAACAMSLLDYFVEHLVAGIRRWAPMMLWAGLIAACLIVVLGTKSRTASAMFLAGAATYLFLRVGVKRSLLIGVPVFALLAGVYLMYTRADLGQIVAKTFQFNDRLRGVVTGTGRFEAWPVIIKEVWWPHALIGMGPGQSGPLVETLTNLTSPHNGLLLNLCEVGLLGTVPLVAWILVAAKRAWRGRGERGSAILIALAVAGLFESLTESTMFSMGNAGSLLFMLAITALAAKVGQPAAESEEGQGAPAAFAGAGV